MAGPKIQLCHDIGPVVFNRLGADKQPFGDLFDRHPFSQESHDFLFPGRERPVCPVGYPHLAQGRFHQFLDNFVGHGAVQKIFTFGRDNKVTLIEKKKGQSGPFLREDWEFRSWGTYDMFGDTIHLFINRFASVRQNFQRLYVEKEGDKITKKTWKNEPQETYDSLITDGSQDRYITYPDLKGDFVRR